MITSVRTRILPACGHPMEYEKVKTTLWNLADCFPCLSVQTIGTSAGGRAIPAVTLGSGEEVPSLLYTGGADGNDWISTAILLRFITDYCLFWAENQRLYSVNLPYLEQNRRICICPMLNCDSALQEPEERRKNGRKNQAGADVLRAFGGMDVPEKCPECTCLQQYMQYFSISLLLSLEVGEHPALTAGSPQGSRTGTLGRLLSRMSGCVFEKRENASPMEDWFSKETGNPAFRCALDLPETEEGYLRGYAALREMLFSAPLLV